LLLTRILNPADAGNKRVIVTPENYEVVSVFKIYAPGITFNTLFPYVISQSNNL
jgi:hypothetical protein